MLRYCSLQVNTQRQLTSLGFSPLPENVLTYTITRALPRILIDTSYPQVCVHYTMNTPLSCLYAITHVQCTHLPMYMQINDVGTGQLLAAF